jgi:hypothetical protein
MSNVTDRRKQPVPSAESEQGGEDFLHRWSRRKHEAGEPGVPEAPATATPEPSAPAPAPVKVLTDADMPPVDSLGADSDYSPFMSPGVSDELRQKALRKLFTLPDFSQRDPLDGEYYDCHGYLPLGDVITHEMREEMEREAQKKAEQLAATQTQAAPAETALATPAPAQRHTRHLRKRSKSKRSRA